MTFLFICEHTLPPYVASSGGRFRAHAPTHLREYHGVTVRFLTLLLVYTYTVSQDDVIESSTVLPRLCNAVATRRYEWLLHPARQSNWGCGTLASSTLAT